MTFTEAITKVLAPLWPIIMAFFAFFGAAIVTISRREVSRKLFSKDDSSNIYATNADLNEFKNDIASSLKDFRGQVAQEFVKHKREVENMCATNQAACNSRVCLKIDGVLIKLNTMDKQREEARKEALTDLKGHTEQLTKLTSCVSNLSGKVEQMEKQLDNKTDKGGGG